MPLPRASGRMKAGHERASGSVWGVTLVRSGMVRAQPSRFSQAIRQGNHPCPCRA